MSCELVIDNFQRTYQPGNTISGRVVCTFNSKERIRGVKVRLRGEEHTEWVETESYYDEEAKETKYRDVQYSGDNDFLSNEIVLVGGKTMKSRRYEYSFTITLPKNLPPTFQGTYGHIKYYIRALVDIPFAIDYEDVRFFKVHAPIDFNDISDSLSLDPSTYQEEKTICCFCCASGPITMDVHLQKEAFVLGEVAKIKIEVTNLSNESIDRVKLRLGTTIEAKTTTPSTRYRYDSELLASDSDSGVGAHGQRTYKFDLEIPSIAGVYNFRRCSLFEQWYVLKIEAVIPGCHSNMEIQTGVDIGHIPLRGERHISRQESSETPSEPSPPPSPVPDEPPPYSASEEAPLYPNAPPEESAPSAPPKAKMAERDDYVSPDGEGGSSGGSSGPPPPTYSDAVTAPSVYPGPPDTNKPSAPSE